MSTPAPLPDLPGHVEPETLQSLDEAALDAIVASVREAERATIVAMAPYDRQLKEIRARLAEVATERRRRERAAQMAQRRAVREMAKAGEMPSLGDLLAAAGSPLAEATPLAEVRLFLRTGGEVRLGFPGRPGPTSFTDGRQSRSAQTWGDARTLYAQGWEPGTAQVSGVRVHLAGTKVERVVTPDEVVVQTDGPEKP